MTKKQFNNYRFEGLEPKDASNKYLTMKRVSGDKNKIVVRVSINVLKPTKYGYALILDKSHVVFLKDWQVSINYFATEILMTRDFYKVSEWGTFPEFEGEKVKTFDEWITIAEAQEAYRDEDGYKATAVSWEK